MIPPITPTTIIVAKLVLECVEKIAAALDD
jgi:hypothetical protein